MRSPRFHKDNKHYALTSFSPFSSFTASKRIYTINIIKADLIHAYFRIKASLDLDITHGLTHEKKQSHTCIELNLMNIHELFNCSKTDPKEKLLKYNLYTTYASLPFIDFEQ